ncbi:DUF3995 domain-containing protein [Paenibacillus sp. HJGM_3]|uniref:DUF3995 domain-containing protein n=1 Tax=Paenibacillus sp. HJGM_3 TaxID=3379816 RepID=UPI003859BC9A
MRFRTPWFIYAGMMWTALFAFMSFYWAAGGMIGVESLGGSIYEMALTRPPGFIAFVWVTGIVKLAGVVLLFGLLRSSNARTKLRRPLSIVCLIAGIFMILYGVGNFITISLSAMNVLHFDLTPYAFRWRLLFWEPYWICGGLLYVLAGYKLK